MFIIQCFIPHSEILSKRNSLVTICDISMIHVKSFTDLLSPADCGCPVIVRTKAPEKTKTILFQYKTGF